MDLSDFSPEFRALYAKYQQRSARRPLQMGEPKDPCGMSIAQFMGAAADLAGSYKSSDYLKKVGP